MSLSKFLDPKNDFAFRRIFGAERNKDILIHFINDILDFKGDDQIESVEFLKTIQEPEVAARKQSIVDVLCRDQKGRTSIIEMQVARTKDFAKRAQYYAAKAYVSQMKEGQAYENLKEVIFIAITDFVMFPEKEDYRSDHVILDKKSAVRDLKDFSFTFLELPKFKKEKEDLETIVERWAYFFKHAAETRERDLDEIIGQDVIVKRAYEELNRFGWSEEELFTYEQDEKRIRDNKAALDYQFEKGIAIGVEKGIEKVALKMLSDKTPVSEVSKYTGLSEQEVQNLLDN